MKSFLDKLMNAQAARGMLLDDIDSRVVLVGQWATDIAKASSTPCSTTRIGAFVLRAMAPAKPGLGAGREVRWYLSA